MGRKTDKERFWEKVNKNGPLPKVNPSLGPCWLWTKGVQNGYGIFSIAPEVNKHLNVKAHRWAYEQEIGPITHTLDHLCRVTNCVRPSHLEDVTKNVNSNRNAGHIPTRTHCPRGHSYAEHGRMQSGYPICKVCDREKRVLQRRQKWDRENITPRRSKYAYEPGTYAAD